MASFSVTTMVAVIIRVAAAFITTDPFLPDIGVDDSATSAPRTGVQS